MTDINLLKTFVPDLIEKSDVKNPLVSNETDKGVLAYDKFMINTQNIKPSLLKYLILNQSRFIEGTVTQSSNNSNPTKINLTNVSEEVSIKSNLTLPEKSSLQIKIDVTPKSPEANSKPEAKLLNNPEVILKDYNLSGKIIKINNTPTEKFINENPNIKNNSNLNSADFQLTSNLKKTPFTIEVIRQLPKSTQPNQFDVTRSVSRETNNYQNINFSTGESIVVKLTRVMLPQPAIDIKHNTQSTQPTQAAEKPQQSQPNQLPANVVKGEVLSIKMENSPIVQISKDLFFVLPKELKLPPKTIISMEIVKKIPLEIKNSAQEKWPSIKEVQDFFKPEKTGKNFETDSIVSEKKSTHFPVQENSSQIIQNPLKNFPAPLKNDNSFMGNLFKMILKIPQKIIQEIIPSETLNILKETPQGENIIKNISQDLSESVKLKSDTEGNNWRETSIPIINDTISHLNLLIKEDLEEQKKSNKNSHQKIRFVVECEFFEMGFIQFEGFANRKEKNFKLILRTETNFSEEFSRDIEKIFYNVLSQTNYSGQIKIDKNSRPTEFFEKLSINGKGVIA